MGFTYAYWLRAGGCVALALWLLLVAGCGAGLCANQFNCGIDSGAIGDGSTGTGEGSSEVTRSFPDFIASMMHREKTAVQKTLRQELELGTAALPTGYRIVPLIGSDIIPTPGDDDGDGSGSVTFATRPATPCGASQDTVEGRIADCAAANGATAEWDGSVNGNSGQAVWKLVTYNSGREVWRDERTQLIWSDRLGQTNWCRASGSSGGGAFAEADQYGYCDNITYQPNQGFPESWCREDPALDTPSIYDAMKGGMRLTATATSPSIVWRLATKWDWHIAEVDGIRFPLPNMLYFFWSSTLYATGRNSAWSFVGSHGNIGPAFRNGTLSVRCVGR